MPKMLALCVLPAFKGSAGLGLSLFHKYQLRVGVEAEQHVSTKSHYEE